MAREHRSVHGEAYVAYDAPAIEASHGDPDKALQLLDFSIDICHRAGDRSNLAAALARFKAVSFGHVLQPDATATIHGDSSHLPGIVVVVGLSEAVGRLRSELGQEVFDDRVAHGAGMEPLARQVWKAT